MARTKRSAKLDNPTSRLKLKPGVRHQTPLEPGHYLAYRRPLSKAAGTWLARWNDPEAKAEAQSRIGIADDYSLADGEKILTYAQAQAKAREWFEQQADDARLARDGVVRKRGPYTVAEAMEDYFVDAERRGVKAVSRDRQRASAWILPHLGAVEVAQLTRLRIEKWQALVADSPRRVRTRQVDPNASEKPVPKPRKFKKPRQPRKAAPVPPGPPATLDEVRARKESANRVLATLKAALNHALARHRVKHGEAWREVKPFENTTKSRIRFLPGVNYISPSTTITSPHR
jgi:hypothetical protein